MLLPMGFRFWGGFEVVVYQETGTLWGPHFYVFLKHFLTNII